LIVHGGADTKVPLAQAQKFHDALRTQNVPAELVIFPGMGHDLTRDGAADAGVNRQALEKVAVFLSRTFPPGPISQKVAGPRGRGPLY
jgi:dipeptidyl aminopeptidase/acylaminoacyl peptidase